MSNLQLLLMIVVPCLWNALLIRVMWRAMNRQFDQFEQAIKRGLSDNSSTNLEH